ncbi:MAG: FAD-binding oxidoreductase [Bacteroidia bacterium]
MSKFHALTVKDITRETADCVSVSFHIPQQLVNDFKYIQGQYITFKLHIDGQEIRRSYSVCSSPITDADLRVAIKKVKNGKGSTYINDRLKVGDVLEVMTPMGNFYTAMDAGNNKEYVLFAGGSGITPMLSIIKTVLQAEPNSRIQLFYGNENEEAIIFNNQLKDLQNKHADRLKVHHILNNATDYPEIYKGMMTVEKLSALMQQFVKIDNRSEIFICGPVPMMQNVEQTLQQLNVPKSQIHIEYFSAPVESTAAPSVVSATKKATLTIILDGDEVVTEMMPDESILDAALRINLDAPYACQGGSCCTCRALLTEGKVDMKVNYALLDAEVKQGFILTCQSYALTESITVDYDKGR